MDNSNEIIKSYAILGIKQRATLTEVRSAYLDKTSQKQFLKIFISNEEIVDEFKRYHAAYVQIMREFSESENTADLNLYPPDQVFKLILNQGIYFMTNGNFVKAGEKFQEAYSINRKNETVLTYLGVLLLKRKNYYAAEKYFLEAIKINKENDDIWIFLGDTYLKAGKHSKALTMYETAKKLNPLRVEISEKIKPLKDDKKNTGEKKGSFLKNIINKIIK
jgi:tetratricopeptide (TPR) repeat protein